MSEKKPPIVKPSNRKSYILGLDLGVMSIGWAAVEIRTKKNGDADRNSPVGILDMGVRRFDAGVSGTQEEIRKGKDQSHATDRRNARSARRLSWRRKRRKQRVYRLLVKHGLLPETDGTPESITNSLQALDRQLHKKHVTPGDRHAGNVVPYTLRALALTEQLEPFELGRAIYHLAQRRGFLSNRKAPPKKDEDEGVVKASISQLYDDIEASGCETLGEYLSNVDAEGDTRSDDHSRIRGRWTERKMYIDEFNLILERQLKYHDQLGNEDFTKELRDAIFDQRPLKSQASLIGTCDLVPGRRRAAKACLPFQQFRLMQKLNDLTYIDGSGEKRELDTDQKSRLRDELLATGDLTWARVRKIIGLGTKNKETGLPLFSHEEGGDKKLVGDRTSAKLISKIPDKFASLSREEQTELVDEIRSYADEEMLAKRLRERWSLSDAEATEVSALRFEPGYGSLSRKAIAILIPKLDAGMQLQSAIKDSPELSDRRETPLWPLLPPQGDNAKLWKENRRPDRLIYESFSNPTVARSLSELRKVVNALIRRYGRPEFIRVELARDLKNSRTRRADLSKRRDRNQAIRAAAKVAIEQEYGNDHPSRSDIEKWLLAEECGFICPYSGKPIPRSKVLTAEFEIEHIVPFSLSFDNSFANKTLSHRDWNRDKGNRTPFAAFGSRKDWAQIVQRVKRFFGPYARTKLDRFLREQPEESDFIERQLSETRYLARQATDYLSLLYGGIVEPREEDAVGRRRVLVTPGRATSLLRKGWQLEAVTGGAKNRKDHRHHAIDALIIALTQDGFLKKLSQAAERANEMQLSRLTTEIDPPWKSFIKDAKTSYERINVSCRPNRKLNGGLHKETVFSRPLHEQNAGNETPKFFAVRKPLVSLTKNEVGNIVDDRVREIVMEHLNNHDGDLKAAFSDPNQHPSLPTKSGRPIPIHRVRVRRREKPRRIGKKTSERYVVPGANHHLQIISQLDENGQESRWVGRVVSRLDAMTKFRNWKSSDHVASGATSPLRQSLAGDREELRFSLMPGDHLLIDLEDEKQVLCRVNNISESDIELQRHNDARSATELRKISGGRIRRSPETLRRDNARKVEVSPLGEVFPSGR